MIFMNCVMVTIYLSLDRMLSKVESPVGSLAAGMVEAERLEKKTGMKLVAVYSATEKAAVFPCCTDGCPQCEWSGYKIVHGNIREVIGLLHTVLSLPVEAIH